MTFSTALNLLKKKERLAREGWNGKGMYIELADMSAFENHLPFIMMKTADDKFVPWLASQTDVLANDWTVVE